MADPTIQTFCCHRASNGTEMGHSIMKEFNTEAYNIICLGSSMAGILGALYQILPRQHFAINYRWISTSTIRGRRIVIWLAIADLMASLGVFTRSALWLNYKNIMPAVDDEASVLFCALSSAWIQYFYTATWIWTLIYAIDMRLLLTDRADHPVFYHTLAWVIPAFLTSTGLSLLYIPDANCHDTLSMNSALTRILPNYCATYIPIAAVMIANPWLYQKSTKDMERIVTSTSGQFTIKERYIMDSIKVKFCMINFVFYMCWLPNLVNGVLLWTQWFKLPIRFIVFVWYAMAVMNPLQALFNCLVYRRWKKGSERVVLPFKKAPSTNVPEAVAAAPLDTNQSDTESSIDDENLPLMHGNPTASINNRCYT